MKEKENERKTEDAEKGEKDDRKEADDSILRPIIRVSKASQLQGIQVAPNVVD